MFEQMCRRWELVSTLVPVKLLLLLLVSLSSSNELSHLDRIVENIGGIPFRREQCLTMRRDDDLLLCEKISQSDEERNSERRSTMMIRSFRLERFPLDGNDIELHMDIVTSATDRTWSGTTTGEKEREKELRRGVEKIVQSNGDVEEEKEEEEECLEHRHW